LGVGRQVVGTARRAARRKSREESAVSRIVQPSDVVIFERLARLDRV
jgi:hypothetical protein